MIIPIRCFSCNRVLASKYRTYQQLLAKANFDDNILSGDVKTSIESEQIVKRMAIFEALGIEDRYCCKRHVISHIDLIEKI